MEQFTRASSWRKQTVALAATHTTQVDFLDTKPNAFFVVNTSQETLFMGISEIPTPNKYEFRIDPASSDVVARPFGTDRIYIENESGSDIEIIVYSYEGAFSIGDLKKFSLGVKMNDLKWDGKITGFQTGASLPTGNNKIGKVEVTNPSNSSCPWTETLINTLIENTSNSADKEVVSRRINLSTETPTTLSCNGIIYLRPCAGAINIKFSSNENANNIALAQDEIINDILHPCTMSITTTASYNYIDAILLC